MSKSTTSVKSAPKNSVKSEAPAEMIGAQDALNGRISSRTHAIHVVLIAAYEKGATLKTAQIVEGARALLTKNHASYEKLDRTAPSHLNTMKKRQFIERVDGAWRLTKLGAETAGAEAPKTKKSRRK